MRQKGIPGCPAPGAGSEALTPRRTSYLETTPWVHRHQAIVLVAIASVAPLVSRRQSLQVGDLVLRSTRGSPKVWDALCL